MNDQMSRTIAQWASGIVTDMVCDLKFQNAIAQKMVEVVKPIEPEIDYEDLRDGLDYSELAASIDYSELASEYCMADIAGELDVGEIAECIDQDALVEMITVDTDTITKSVVDRLDYDELSHFCMQNAKKVNTWLPNLVHNLVDSTVEKAMAQLAIANHTRQAEILEAKSKVWWRRALRSMRKMIRK